MAITKEHIRFSIHFAFHLNKNAAEATEMICAAYGKNAVSHATCKRWYQKFRQGDFSLEDEPRAGRPQKIESDELQALLDINSAQTEKELAEQFGVTRQAISVRLHAMGKVQKEGRWVPHKLCVGDQVESPKTKSSRKIEASKKTETVEEKKPSSRKRENNANDKSVSKKAKVEIKESKNKSDSSTARKTKATKSESGATKSEPKQVQNKTDTNLNEINFECTKTNNEGKKYNLKICSWNVSGLRAVLKKNGLDYIIKEDADIVALQETKCDKDKIPDEVKIPGYHHYFFDSKKSGYCGLAVFCKEKPIAVKYGLNNADFDNEGRIITAEFSEFFMINVYVPNAGKKLITLPKKLEWNKAFKKYVEELDKKKPVVICGDMNVAHQEIDLKNPKTNTKNAGFTKEERDGMTEFLAAGFVDTFRMLYPDQEGAYTFWTYFANARGKDIGWRLDYFLVSERMKNKVCDNVIRKQVYGSDHCPVILFLNV